MAGQPPDAGEGPRAGRRSRRHGARCSADKVFTGLGLTPQREQHKPDPRRFGRYIVLDVLGQGSMGTVLKGYDEELNRQVALKVLHSDPTERKGQRLKREAQALARLSHPNVVAGARRRRGPTRAMSSWPWS